jgi:hypothetical protein
MLSGHPVWQDEATPFRAPKVSRLTDSLNAMDIFGFEKASGLSANFLLLIDFPEIISPPGKKVNLVSVNQYAFF